MYGCLHVHNNQPSTSVLRSHHQQSSYLHNTVCPPTFHSRTFFLLISGQPDLGGSLVYLITMLSCIPRYQNFPTQNPYFPLVPYNTIVTLYRQFPELILAVTPKNGGSQVYDFFYLAGAFYIIANCFTGFTDLPV